MTPLVDVSPDRDATIRLCEERAETYGALRGSCLTSIALDRAAAQLRADGRRLTAEQANAAEIAEWKEAHDFYAGLYAERCGQVAELTALLREARDRIAMLQRAISTGDWNDPELDGASGPPQSMLKAAAAPEAREFKPPPLKKDDLITRIDTILNKKGEGQ